MNIYEIKGYTRYLDFYNDIYNLFLYNYIIMSQIESKSKTMHFTNDRNFIRISYSKGKFEI